jgi:hypothetical protein
VVLRVKGTGVRHKPSVEKKKLVLDADSKSNIVFV